MNENPPLGFEPPLVDPDNPRIVKDGVVYDEKGQPWQRWKYILPEPPPIPSFSRTATGEWAETVPPPAEFVDPVEIG